MLGIAIAATTTVFSGVHAVMLAPLPFEDADRLVTVFERNPEFGWEDAPAAPANLLDWRERVEAFEDVAGYRSGSLGSVAWASPDGPRRLDALQVTGNFFDVLGLRPHRGSWPTYDDTWSDAGPWAVVSHGFWRDDLGGVADVQGVVLDLDGRSVRVRAVLPAGVRFPSEQADLWLPYSWDRTAPEQAWFRRAHFVTAVARLADGVLVEAASAQLDAVALQLQVEHPELNANMFAGLTPLRTTLVGDLGRPLTTLLAAVAVLLLLGCVNVGNLFLARALARESDLSVRRAVGAGRGRIVAHLTAEAVWVGVAGGRARCAR